MLVDDFSYELPPEAIAQTAIDPRDASRLLDTTTMTDRVFRELPKLLDAGDLLVVNETKVRAARLVGERDGGGTTEVLLTGRIDNKRWEALVRPARKLSPGSVVAVGPLRVELLSTPVDGVATVLVEGCSTDIEDDIAAHGSTPLPPYFHGEVELGRYQTVFASKIGSSAAPTAALHFTPELVSEIEATGVGIAAVDLEVGIDTFRPMDRGRNGAATVEAHRMHSERVVVPPATVDAVERTRRSGGRVIAVGTTVVRSLESAATPHGGLAPFDGSTDLFIRPGFRFAAVDAVITNFHAPRTTLLVMIAALMGDRWRSVYRLALDQGYRFLSFGDAMYLEVRR
ncbi:MAG: tRNA preQ1(34) S-adenosylmethionine ribosyltransferase-isomerase QueA [Acidimicrobiia bacterium]